MFFPEATRRKGKKLVKKKREGVLSLQRNRLTKRNNGMLEKKKKKKKKKKKERSKINHINLYRSQSLTLGNNKNLIE